MISQKKFNYYTLEGIGSVFIDVELMDEDMEVTDMICVLSTLVQISEILFGFGTQYTMGNSFFFKGFFIKDTPSSDFWL